MFAFVKRERRIQVIPCLRALNAPLFTEHRQNDDFSFALPGELLSLPFAVCDESDHEDSGCACRRVFVGLYTRRPSTLALVCEEDEEKLHEEFRSSAAVTCWRQRGPENVLVHGLGCVAAGLSRISPGEIVRIDRSGLRIRLVNTRMDDLVETARLALQLADGHLDL